MCVFMVVKTLKHSLVINIAFMVEKHGLLYPTHKVWFTTWSNVWFSAVRALLL